MRFSNSVKTLLICCLISSCANTIPVGDYSEPDSDKGTALLRIISNAQVSGAVYQSCISEEGLLTNPGKFKNGEPNGAHPPFPVTEKTLGMLPRFAPPLSQYWSGRLLAEGDYGEAVAEYRVPAGTPFILHSHGTRAVIGQMASVCEGQSAVYVFEEGKQYEMFSGYLVLDNGQQVCPFSVYPIDNPMIYYTHRPIPLTAENKAIEKCSSSQQASRH